MLTTKNGAKAVHVFFVACSTLFLFAGCADPGPKALLEGERLLKEKKFSDAIPRFQTAVELLPQNAQAWNHLGLAYHYSGQWSKAVENYEQALQLNRNLAAARYNLGQLYFDQGQFNAAASQLTTFVTLEPKNGDAWNKLATAQLRHSAQLTGAEKTKWLDAAKRNFEVALQFQQDPGIYNSLGMIEVQRGRAKDSIRHFNSALQKQPNYAPAILNLAVVNHVHLNDRRTALQRYREFLAYQPRSSRLREVEAAAHQIETELNPPQYVTNLVSQVLAPPPVTSTPAPVVPSPQPKVELRTNVAAAKPVLPTPAPAKNETAPQPKTLPTPAPVEVTKIPEEIPVKIAQDTPPKKETIAPSSPPEKKDPSQEATAAISEEAEAKQKAGFIKRLNPTTWFRDKTNEPSKTQTVVEPTAKLPPIVSPIPAPKNVALVSKPESPRYRYVLPATPRPGNRSEAARIFGEAVQAQRQGDSNKALELYRRATKADPAFFEAHYNLGLVALERNLLSEALIAYETALAISPDSSNARYNFAFGLQKANYLTDAANEFEKLLARNPKETRAHLSLANLYSQQPGYRDRARQHYQKVLEIEPQHPQAVAIRYWLRDNP